MKVEFINPFISAAIQVLNQELGREIQITRGKLSVQKSPYTTMAMTVMIAVTGGVQGIVFFGFAERTVKNFVSEITGTPVPIINAMVESALAELGNVITGIASAGLEKAGYPCDISPPMVVTGRGSMISTLNIARLQIPLKTEIGEIEISVALK